MLATQSYNPHRNVVEQPVSHDRNFVLTVQRDDKAKSRRERMQNYGPRPQKGYFAFSQNPESWDVWQYEPIFKVREAKRCGEVKQELRTYQNDTRVHSNLAGLPVDADIDFIGFADATNGRPTGKNGKSVTNNGGFFACAAEGHRSYVNLSEETFHPGDWAIWDTPKGPIDPKTGNIARPREVPDATPDDKFLLTFKPLRFDRTSQLNLGSALLEKDLVNAQAPNLNTDTLKHEHAGMIAHIFALQMKIMNGGITIQGAIEHVKRYLPEMSEQMDGMVLDAGQGREAQCAVLEKLKGFLTGRHYEFYLRRVAGKITNHCPPNAQLNMSVRPGY